MDYNWQLDSLYKGFDDPHFLGDIKYLKEKIKTLNESAKKIKDSTSLESFILEFESFLETFYLAFTYANLNFSADTSNKDALNYMNQLSIMNSELAGPLAKMKTYLKSVTNVDDLIHASKVLTQYAFVIESWSKSAEHMLTEREEVLASHLSITGSNAFSLLQSQLTSQLTADVTLDGKKQNMTISEIRNLAYSDKADVRKAAYDAELKAYEKIDEGVSMSLNAIKGEVITLSKRRGYESPLQMTLEQTNMSPKTLEAMLGAMKKSLPKFHEYLKVKGQLLGHQKGLPFYDLFAPMGELNKTYTYEEACDFILEQFGQFSDSLKEVAHTAMSSNWIDVSPKAGKVSGAFCADIPKINEFRVLTNFTGSLGDVITLAHELGHGYHATRICQESILNQDTPMPLAETASTFCETIVNQATLKTASKKEAFTILENTLQDSTQVVCDIYSRFLFESKVFDIRAEQPLSVALMKEAMIEAQKTAYGDGLDPESLHPYMWLIKSHYYSAGLNFYNFPYTFGLLFAKGLYAKYLDAPEEFVSKYDVLLASTGKMSIVDVCKIMDIDAESQAFWTQSLSMLEKDIDQFIELSKEV